MIGGPHLCLFHPQETSGGFGLRFYSSDTAAFLSSTHSILEGALQSLVVSSGRGNCSDLEDTRPCLFQSPILSSKQAAYR